MELRERKQAEDFETLKDKLKVKWHNRDFTPKKEDSDRITMRFFFAMLVSLLVESVVCLIPYAFAETRWIHTFIAVLLSWQVLINWHRSYYDTTNYVTGEMKSNLYPDSTGTPEGWKNCIKCQACIFLFL